jgi:hypothetical protein
VFLLCTFRSDDLASSIALADWLGSLERNLPVRRQALSSLTFEETLRLVQSLFGTERGTTGNEGEGQAEKEESIEVWSRWLFAETRGHPFFLIEHLKLLAERKSLFHNEAGTAPITADLILPQEAPQSHLPSSVRDFIHARLTRLSQSALTLCMAAAVLGDGFTFDQLCRVAEINENQALSALDEAVTRGLLQETEGASSPTIAYVQGPTPKQGRAGDESCIDGRSRPSRRHRPLLLNWLSMRWPQGFLTPLLSGVSQPVMQRCVYLLRVMPLCSMNKHASW